MDQLLAGFDENGLRERGWTKVDLGQGDAPHAEGGFGTDTGRAKLHARYEPPAEVADAASPSASRSRSSRRRRTSS